MTVTQVPGLLRRKCGNAPTDAPPAQPAAGDDATSATCAAAVAGAAAAAGARAILTPSASRATELAQTRRTREGSDPLAAALPAGLSSLTTPRGMGCG
eukprot:gene23312-39078_t